MGEFPTEFDREFIRRTKANLEFVQKAYTNDKKVFEITQLINSMLGLLVFPEQKFYDLIAREPLDTFRQDGWEIPQPTICEKPDWNNLQDFIRHLRNGISHHQLKFSSNDNREVSGLTIWDKCNKSKPKNWEVEFTIEQLVKFTEKMTEYFLKLAETGSGEEC